MTNNPLKLEKHTLSVVIPLYNEESGIKPLLERIDFALQNYAFPWELILVDDGSLDNTLVNLNQEMKQYGDHIRALSFQRNYGQTAAMQAGIDAARGSVIVTMDGDLQNDPVDIPSLVSHLIEEDLDLVVGWRKDRKDDMVLRKIPSMIANKLIGRITGVRLHDYGCSLKAYRSSVIKDVRLYGEMHRFIPAWVATKTQPSRIKEIVVTHNAREIGESKYGIARTFGVLLDLLSVYFFMRFSARPGHFFGKLAIISGSIGGIILSYLFVLKIFGESIGGRPLLMVGILLTLASIQFLTTGIMAEMMSRTYFESSDGRAYTLRNHHNNEKTGEPGWHNKSVDNIN